MSEIQLEVAQAQAIVEKHLTVPARVEASRTLSRRGNSYSSKSRCFVLDINIQAEDTYVDGLPTQTCFLILAHPHEATSSEDLEYHSNTLEITHQLLSLISSQIHSPDPSLPPVVSHKTAGILDTTLTLLPYHYILSPLIPFPSRSILSLAEARNTGKLSPQNLVSLELRLGHFFGQLHSQVQNDWFGLPVDTQGKSSPKLFGELPGLSISINEPPYECGYSWQETFTALVDDLLLRLKKRDEQYPADTGTLAYEEVQRCLSRAIGSFLFDDVDVPSLIWFTGGEENIYIVDPEASEPSDSIGAAPGTFAAMIPEMGNAIWGDPLLESVMLGSGDILSSGKATTKPSQAFMEGYLAGGGKNPRVFPRHTTKRIWYNVLLALVTLVGDTNGDEDSIGEQRKEQMNWARKVLDKSVEKLKDAPCY